VVSVVSAYADDFHSLKLSVDELRVDELRVCFFVEGFGLKACLAAPSRQGLLQWTGSPIPRLKSG